jgi:hypothetical protein
MKALVDIQHESEATNLQPKAHVSLPQHTSCLPSSLLLLPLRPSSLAVSESGSQTTGSVSYADCSNSLMLIIAPS